MHHYRNVQDEKLIREAVREILRSNDITRNSTLRHVMMGGSGMSDWDLVREYARGGRSLLTESQRSRGRSLVENLWNGITGAASWLGGAVASGTKRGIASLKKLGKDAIDAAGRVFTKILDSIPGGKAAYEMLSDFSAEVAEKIGEYIKNALIEFADFMIEKKNDIVSFVFKGAAEPGIFAKIKEIGEEAISELKDKGGAVVDTVKEFITLLNDNPIAAAKKLFEAREILGEIAKRIIDAILKTSKSAKQSISNAIMGVDFFRTKPGKLVLRLMSLLSADMGGQAVIRAASRVWSSIKGISKVGGIDIDRVDREIQDSLSDIVKGLVSGDGAIEQIIRASIGDPGAAAKLLKNAIKMTFNAIKNRVEDGTDEFIKEIGLDPESAIGKGVAAGIGAIVGAAGGALGVEESRKEYRALIIERRLILTHIHKIRRIDSYAHAR